MTNYDQLIQFAMVEVEQCKSLDNLEKIRIKYFGKSGLINVELKKISSMSVELKKENGKRLNKFKIDFFEKLNFKKLNIEKDKINKSIVNDFSDPTMPHRESFLNFPTIHPITQTLEEITIILEKMGLEYSEGPDIEDDFHNFTALNIPKNHPARQMHDTFYLSDSDDNVLRTHTSPVQIRTMKSTSLPIKIFAPGRTYRCDSDQTHTPMFHQVEGLVVDKKINFANLKWFLKKFCQLFFKKQSLKLRFRPSFFPFTEPSAEVDINYFIKDGKISLGEGEKWMEILGCGMVHPNVFKACDLDSKSVRGFAFGMGIERMAMLKYGISDLRSFYDGNIEWLKHYGFSFLDFPE